MTFLWIPSLVASLLATTHSAAPAAEDQTPWVSLFNGSDLSGWTVKCKPADKDKVFWKVDAGAILADSMADSKHDYVWLVTDREYSDFALRIKFQAYRNSPGNSGVQVRSRYDDDAFWLDGPQIDIHPPGPWRTGMIWDETRGNNRWIFPKVEPAKWVNQKMAHPELNFHYADQEPAWNDLQITCIGTRIKAILNGLVVTDYDGSGVLDDEVHRKRNVGLRGHIALQIHTGDPLRIRFKDIFVKDLAPANQ